MPGGDNSISISRECEESRSNSTTKQQNIVLMEDFKGAALTDDATGAENKPLTMQRAARMCRFPKLEECAHFHYERVQLGALAICLVNERLEQFISKGDSIAAPSSLQSFSLNNAWFLIKVSTRQSEPFFIKRSFDNMKMFDEMLHRCVYDRKISGLCNLNDKINVTNEQEIEYMVSEYLERFSKIASDSLTCGTILTWLQLDNKGRRLPLADDDTMRSINTPAVGAAYGVRRYQAQATDEISIELGDMISVIDMPAPAESVWWRGKKSNWQKSHYEVGFFPQSCVATIGDKVPRHFPLPAPLVTEVDVSPTKPVLRKHGKLIAFFRSFILSRPSRRRLKQSGIYRERVFSCDLSEHLLNSGQEIPLVLKCCAEFIEANGIVDGIYRLSGITSNIQKLRQAFDEERVPDLGNPEMRQDIHAVSSLLKMYFRELPNPLCTYQLYENFVEAIQKKGDNKERLRLMRETVIQLPPPHYRTLRYLVEHLYRVSQFSERTGMTDKNLAIVWAPNLLRSTSLEAGGVAALQGVGVQAVVTEFLIRYSLQIFNELYAPQKATTCMELADSAKSAEIRLDAKADCENSMLNQYDLDQSLVQDRPKSINSCGAKLISLEEAQERQSQKEVNETRNFMPISLPSNMGSYIEVGGGPASLPEKYHTVLSVPRSWQKRKPHTWKSLFMRNQRVGGNGMSHKRPDIHHIKDIEIARSITNSAGDNPIVDCKLLKEQKTKSVEFFDTNKTLDAADRYVKGSDLCLRSNSIDSLRTVGHSRSASHDSYFDMLQSPLHHNNKASPSRELNELYLNFDLEEPEMHIFSESESLVNSPRIDKENLELNYVCLGARRILRTRPDEFFSQTNSINPSPKKQPRLNLLSPVNNAAIDKKQDELTLNDKHFGKRYKLEDQFPDIQFIDCSTPQHSVYTSHKMPKTIKNDIAKEKQQTVTNAQQTQVQAANKETSYARYSYPSLQPRAARADREFAKERLSYPVERLISLGNLQESNSNKSLASNESPVKIKGLSGNVMRSSSYSNQAQYGAICMRRNSPRGSRLFSLHDIELEVPDNSSKLSVTPSSAEHSPRYTLLDGDTSSENPSSANTPQYEVVDELENVRLKHNISADSLTYEETPMKTPRTEISDKRALKKELSLDLVELTAKPMQARVAKTEFIMPSHEDKQKKQELPLLSSPNSSVKTDNTSASMTPSEFGYQSLYRQSSVCSLQDIDAEIAASSNLESPMSTRSLLSPMQKSTISITYNMRSEKMPEMLKTKAIPIPHETKIDDNNIYDQLHVFRNSVSDLNKMIQTKNQYELSSPIINEQNEHFIEKFNNKTLAQKDNTISSLNNKQQNKYLPQINARKSTNDTDPTELIMDDNCEDTFLSDDKRRFSLSNCCKELLYENVKLRKPQNVYVNVMVTNSTKQNLDASNNIKTSSCIEPKQFDKGIQPTVLTAANNKEPNFSVKQLANKFENTSTNSEQRQMQNSTKTNLVDKVAVVEQSNSVKSLATQPKLHNVKQITRSLDEVAFQRECNLKQQENISVSATKLQDELGNLVAQRRKSFDFTRPKSLNPPKALPLMSAKTIPILEQKVCAAEQPLAGVFIVSSFEAHGIDFSSSSILSDVKLDRERIERIKEERRQQLMKKYGLKSRSKTELNADIFNEDFLKARSKSRGDISQIVQIDGHFIKSSNLDLFRSNNHVNKINCKPQLIWQKQEAQNAACNVADVEKKYSSHDKSTTYSMHSIERKSKNYKQRESERNNLQNNEETKQRKHETETITLSSSLNSDINMTNHLTNKRNQEISTQFSIRDVTAMFESRAHSQQ